MVADTVVFCYTKKFEKTGQGCLLWYPKERADLKAIHDENNVLTDDELVVARDFLRESRYGSLYIQTEYPFRFRMLNHV